VWVTGGNVSDKEKDTKPGAMDDDSMHRAKKNKKKKHDMMKAIFDDNETGRYSGPTDS
jgi:hypothetical protein